MPAAKRPSAARVALLLFLAASIVYQSNLRPVAAADSLPTALLPFSILLDGALHLDRFTPALRTGPSIPYIFHEKDGHVYSTYPLSQPILLTPLYIPIVAAILPAASVAFFFLLLDRLTTRRNAVLLTIVYAFATSTWTIASQALWQHSG